MLCAAACVRVWYERALGLALVRDVLAFLWLMAQDPRLPMDQRKKARDILQQFLAPLQPPLNRGGVFSTDLTSCLWLQAILEDYDRERGKIGVILRSNNDATAILSVLQTAYPDIPLDDLSRIVERAKAKSSKNLRPDRLTEALMAWHYGSSSLDAIHKALTRARKARKIQETLLAP